MCYRITFGSTKNHINKIELNSKSKRFWAFCSMWKMAEAPIHRSIIFEHTCYDVSNVFQNLPGTLWSVLEMIWKKSHVLQDHFCINQEPHQQNSLSVKIKSILSIFQHVKNAWGFHSSIHYFWAHVLWRFKCVSKPPWDTLECSWNDLKKVSCVTGSFLHQPRTSSTKFT